MAKDESVPWGYATERTWRNTLWITYKLTSQAWQGLWDRQGGKCAGCLAEFAHPIDRTQRERFGVKPQVDHRHRKGETGITAIDCKTEDVRGLLCGPCNRLLGTLQDNKPQLERLAAYLKQHGDYYG